MITSTKPSKAQAIDAARSFLRHRDRLGDWRKDDLLMGLGRLYAFPPGTSPWPPAAKLTVENIAAFIQAHAVEIE